MLGTSHYLSPEQAAGGSIGPPSDVYSMGCVLYEMLTGAVPFTGESPVGIAMRHVSEEVPPPSSLAADVPPAVDDVVAKATAKDPKDRFADGRDMAVALAHAGDPSGVWSLRRRSSTDRGDDGRRNLGADSCGSDPGSSSDGLADPGGSLGAPACGLFRSDRAGILATIAAPLLLVNLFGDDDPTQNAGGGGPGPNQEEQPADETQGEEEPEPEAISLDGYVGQFYADAEEQLKAEGIEVACEDVDSAEQPELVVDQDPGKGHRATGRHRHPLRQ